ncbi:MAG: phosphatidylserine decarboxylase [candidate division Zixibacteria bacterium]|nr:phosphatidylserine decarboxylase [candidate division Zixibacteria bacterium]
MVRDGWVIVTPLCSVVVVCLMLNQWRPSLAWGAIAGLAGVLALFIGFFFRDPTRSIPQGEGLIVSAADGKVVAIRRIEHEPFLDGPAIQISVFLSIFNVHVNRIPLTGVIRSRVLRKGQYKLAHQDAASDDNEQLALGIETDKGRYVVKQIVGFIARRIVCYVQEGERVETGFKYGLIRFGSRVDILIPPETTIVAKLGDRVKSGETVMGVFS